MMAKKEYQGQRPGKKPARKQYTPLQKYQYHYDRRGNLTKHKLRYGGPKHSYSEGFVQAFEGRNNTAAMTHEFGKHSGRAYAKGYERGRKAAFEYQRTTGKQPGDIYREIRRG